VKPILCTLAALLVLIPTVSSGGAAAPAKRPQIGKAALIAAARQATLKDIDYGQNYCDSDITVDAWLKALVGKEARAITWNGGECELVNPYGTLIDAKEWPYCAQATVTLKHPKSRTDRAVIEIYFESPVDGHPGVAYAFRSMSEDIGYLRTRKEFEASWDDRFPPAPDAARCKDE
jgi:hypothetical protein